MHENHKNPANQSPRLLLVDADHDVRARVSKLLHDHAGTQCDTASCVRDAYDALAQHEYDAVLCDAALPEHGADELLQWIRNAAYCTATLVLSDDPTLEEALHAIRAGAVDIVSKSAGPQAFADAVTNALQTSTERAAHAKRIHRLERLCRRLGAAPRPQEQATQEHAEPTGVAPNGWPTFDDEYDQPVDAAHAALAGSTDLSNDLDEDLRDQLDIEQMLRAALEHILAAAGPTNAAVFLPSGASDFNLGAYVNYDCPREAADVLLDHLAGVLAPRFEQETSVQHFTDHDSLAARLGDDAAWLAESNVVVFSCQHEGECLAVVTLFRDRQYAFPQDLVNTLGAVAARFGAHLARAARVHNRFEDPGQNESDGWRLWGNGGDGMAA